MTHIQALEESFQELEDQTLPIPEPAAASLHALTTVAAQVHEWLSSRGGGPSKHIDARYS